MGTDRHTFTGAARSKRSVFDDGPEPIGLSLSRTIEPDVAPVANVSIDNDPELAELFAPRSTTLENGDTDNDHASDGPSVTADDDWQSLLDDSIPVRSLSRSRPAGPVLAPTPEPDLSQFSRSEFDESGFNDRTRLITRVGLAGAVVVCMALIAAVLVPSGDEGELETAADTEEAVAENGAASGRGAPADETEEEATDRTDREATDRTGSQTPVFPVEPILETEIAAAADVDADDPSDPDDSTTVTADASTDPDATDGDTSATTDDGGESSTTTTSDSPTTTSPGSTTTADPTTTAPSTTAGPTTTTCSGASWNLVLDEQFNGSSVDTSVWAPYNSGGNAGHGLRRPSALSVSGGMLNITAQMIDGTLVSGGMQHRHNQTYGRYEFRVRTDQDLSEASSGVVLTWPQSNVHPRDGENNIYETLATPGNRSEFYTFIHKPFGSVHDQDYTVHPTSAAAWHTMAMEWTPSWIKLYRDGSLIKTINETGADLLPDVNHFLAIQLDAWKDSIAANTTMQVDYVKVWSYGGGC